VQATLLSTAATIAPPAVASEDLRELAARVATAWRDAGGVVTRRDARFVMEDETTTLDLRPDRAPAEQSRGAAGGCLRVALVGARGLSFHVTGVGGDEESVEVASTAGVVELYGCGTVPARVKLKGDSGRGALETVIASSSTPLPPVAAVLLERTGGMLPSAPEPGPLPPLPPRATRASAAEARLVAEGFTIAPELTWTASEDGKGGSDMSLDEGCHRLELFAAEAHGHPGRRARLDLDGALRSTSGDILSEDKTIAPDVRLDTCVAAKTTVTVTFEGAPRGSGVLVTHASHPLPTRLPSLWTPEMRAHVAAAMLAHHVKGPTDGAVFLARGASGMTPIPLDVEPGACYLAVAAMERGRTRGHGIALHVVVDGRVSDDDQGSKEDSALLAFCAGGSSRATFEVDGKSAASGWSFAVFRMVGGVWGVDP
jgi:hypothetical protein